MTRKWVTNEQYGQLCRSLSEVARRVDEGTILFNETMDALQQLIENVIPTEMTIGDRSYEILDFLQGDEEYVKGDVMVERAKGMNANLGEDDGQYLLDHRDEIPAALSGKVVFVFTDWRHPGGYSEFVYFVYWCGDRWVETRHWLAHSWSGLYRVLRRKQPLDS